MNDEIKNVEDMFLWKLNSDSDFKRKNNNLLFKSHQSVEAINKSDTNKLNWPHTDTLYSFIYVYYLGLMSVNKDKFDELLKHERKKNPGQVAYSSRFLYSCSKDDAFADLNNSEEMKTFISLYFKLGNVIPIWPGGNEARGKSGLYDIPELFFQKHPQWSECLLQIHPNSEMYNIINKDSLFTCVIDEKGTWIKAYKNAFVDKITFDEFIKNDQGKENRKKFYFAYLRHRNKIIIERSQKLKQRIINDLDEH